MSEPIKWDTMGEAWVENIYLHSHQHDDCDLWEVAFRGDITIEVLNSPDRDLAARAVVAAVKVMRGAVSEPIECPECNGVGTLSRVLRDDCLGREVLRVCHCPACDGTGDLFGHVACGWAFDCGVREAEADAYAKHLMRIQRASFTCGTTGELHDLIDAIDTVLSGLPADSFVFEHNKVNDTAERKRNAELHGLLLQVVTWIGGVPFDPDTIAEVTTAKRRIIEILESAIGSKEE